MADAFIDLNALRHNLAVARQLAGESRVMAVIKADAYGHGMVPVARALGDADAFAVARLEEADALRAAGITHPVMVLSGETGEDLLQRASELDLWLAVYDHPLLELLERVRLPKPIRAWLKVDTGMHRLGFAPGDAMAAWQRLMACRNVARVDWMTHFASAEDADHRFTREQAGSFLALAREGTTSLANSAALIRHNVSRGDWVRPGIMLYGSDPTAGLAPELQPVMTLQSRILAVTPLQPGEGVGYNLRWRATRESRIGTVAIGYGDGYPRLAPDGTPVLVRGRLAPLAGRVSMDMLSVDLTDIPEAREGDTVTLWGRGLPVDTIAAHCDTISYELLCRVKPRVKFHYQQ